jgi:hypothetical protein
VTTRVGADELVPALNQFASLPDWLSAAMDGERVRAELARHVRDLSEGRVRLLSCKPARLRAKKDQWHTRYELYVAEPEGEREVVLVGRLWAPSQRPPARARRSHATAPFGGPTWHGWLPGLRLQLRVQVDDDALPALPTLVEPAAASRLLQQVLRDGGYPEATIASCMPEVVRYKPGSRCTVLVRLTYADPVGGPPPPEVVVLKTHLGDKGETAWGAMKALWELPHARRRHVTLAEPLAYLPLERVLVQGGVPYEQELKELVARAAVEDDPVLLDRLRQALRATARALATIHRSGASYGQVFTFEEELATAREVVARLALSHPPIAVAAEPLLRHLAQAAEEHPADPDVSAHHDFRPGQVLLHEGQVGFVDFDGACMAEPALDVGRFRAKLRDVGICALASRGVPMSDPRVDRQLRVFDELCDEFLLTYQEHAPVSSARVLLWEQSDLLTAMLHAWTKVLQHRLEPRLLLLLHALGVHEHPGVEVPAPAAS